MGLEVLTLDEGSLISPSTGMMFIDDTSAVIITITRNPLVLYISLNHSSGLFQLLMCLCLEVHYLPEYQWLLPLYPPLFGQSLFRLSLGSEAACLLAQH